MLVYQLYALQLRDAETLPHRGRDPAAEGHRRCPPLRGSIYSANGKLLAKSSTVWNIVADPSSILEERRDGEPSSAPAAEHIAELLDDGTTADDCLRGADRVATRNRRAVPVPCGGQGRGKTGGGCHHRTTAKCATAPTAEKGRARPANRIVVPLHRAGHHPQLPLRGVPASSVHGLLQQRWKRQARRRLRPGKILRRRLWPVRRAAAWPRRTSTANLWPAAEADVHDAIDGNNLNLTHRRKCAGHRGRVSDRSDEHLLRSMAAAAPSS